MTIEVLPSVGVANLKALIVSAGNAALESSRSIAVSVAIIMKGKVFGLAGVVSIDLSLLGVRPSSE